ncbi:MAG TPA: hypothetical protein VMV46_21670 [Thermoanaerobaculia bacterium]|nr:hypothetical protein [Thermoanaerobaculia bacterium]
MPKNPALVGVLRTAGALSALVVATALAAPSALQALTYVMATDAELLERSGVVVVGRVVGLEAAPDGRPATDYLVEVERPLKGFLPASTILVRLPGGATPDGLIVRAPGVPGFDRHERVLLFLEPGAEGAYALADLGLGAFREVADGASRVLVRDLATATELAAGSDLEERRRSHLPRDPERFASWLEDRAAGEARDPDYFVAPLAGPRREASAFTLSLSSSGCGSNAGLFLRWREFDDGVSVRVLAADAEQPGVDDPIGGIQRSVAAWNNDAQSNVRLLFAGTTTVTARADGRNTVIFEDPFDNIDGQFSGSGTIATAFVSFFCSRVFQFPGGTALEIAEADVITQNGSGQNYFASRGQVAYDEVIAHELGHFIGIAHSCGDDESPACSTSAAFDAALMRARVHNDGRGAQLSPDDRNAVRALYPKAKSSGPKAPNPPRDLVAIPLSTSEIQLAWVDGSSNETAFLVEERGAFGEFVEIQSLGANATSLIVTGIPQGGFRAYRVRARNGGGDSTYSNEAAATTFVPAAPCAGGESVLCLNDDRFQVSLAFEDFEQLGAPATAQPLTDDTGYFTFFDPANVEVVVKVLDACQFAQSYWVFAGGLTNLQVQLTVSDTTTGATRTYLNELGEAFLPIQDTAAFLACP